MEGLSATLLDRGQEFAKNYFKFVQNFMVLRSLHKAIGLISLSLLLLMGGCGQGGPAAPGSGKEGTGSAPKVEESTTSGRATLVVDESLAPVIEAEARAFMAIHREATIDLLVLPGEEAIAALLNHDTIRAAFVTRQLTREEEIILKRKQLVGQYATLAHGAVSMVVQRSLPLDSLSRDQYLGILSGELTRWEEVDPDLPAGEIVLVYDHPRSGLRSFLRDSVLEGEALGNNAFAMRSSPEVIDYVDQNPRSIGVIGQAWLSDRDDPAVKARLNKVKLLRLAPKPGVETCKESDGSYGPYQSYLYQRCYPLTRSLVSILQEPKLGLGTGFIAYVDGVKGQRVIHKAGLGTVHTIPRMVQFPSALERRQAEKE